MNCDIWLGHSCWVIDSQRALPVWSRSRIKVLPFSPFSECLPLLPFLLRAIIQTSSFIQKRTLTVNHLQNCGEASCAVFQVCFREWNMPVKLGWKQKAQCPGSPSKLLFYFFSSFKTFSPPSWPNLPLGSWITPLIQATVSSLTKLHQTSQNDTWGPALRVTHSISASLFFLVDIICVCCLYDEFFWVLQIFLLSDFYSNKLMYLPICLPVLQADCSIVWLSQNIYQYLIFALLRENPSLPSFILS